VKEHCFEWLEEKKEVGQWGQSVKNDFPGLWWEVIVPGRRSEVEAYRLWGLFYVRTGEKRQPQEAVLVVE